MSNDNVNLSKSELAAIDMMIAHMQENNVTQLGAFPGAIVSAVTKIAKTSLVQNVAKAAVNAAVSALVGTAAYRNDKGVDTNVFNNSGGIDSNITLDDLIRIRNNQAR